MITTLDKETDFYKNLKLAVAMLEYLIPGTEFDIDDCYFDYGANMMWTTILRKTPESHWCDRVQYLCPRDQDKIMFANSPEEILAVCHSLIGGSK